MSAAPYLPKLVIATRRRGAQRCGQAEHVRTRMLGALSDVRIEILACYTRRPEARRPLANGGRDGHKELEQAWPRIADSAALLKDML